MNLIPQPQQIRTLSDAQGKTAVKLVACACADPRVAKAAEKLPTAADGTPLYIRVEAGKPESYTLTTTPEQITIVGGDAAGAFYGIQTLRQMFDGLNFYLKPDHEPEGLPSVEIVDYPGLSHRGFYHDVTRGKVPTLETLKALVDSLVYTKHNSLQLYVQHCFPFKEYGDFIEKNGYLTKEEMRELDEYCHENFVDFIPSISTFGHLYELLMLDQYKHLQEIGDYKQEMHFWPGRMRHHTIDPTMEESFAVVTSLIDQFCECFKYTEYFNITCDETFDLVNGKHAGQDTGKLYTTFVTRLIEYLQAKGKKVMMWADIILQYPEYIEKLPKGVIFLNWCYRPESPRMKNLPLLGPMPVPQINCPGTTTWSRLIENPVVASENILELAEYAYKYNLMGLLNTNWGDYGNPCSIELCMYDLALGGAVAWNRETRADYAFNQAINALIYKRKNGHKYVYMVSSAHERVNWNRIVQNWSNRDYGEFFELHWESEAQVKSAIAIANEAIARLTDDDSWGADNYREELLCAARGVIVLAQATARINGYKIEETVDPQAWYEEYAALWMRSNKASELYRIKEFVDYMDGLAR